MMKLRAILYRVIFGNGLAYHGPLWWAVADWLACKPNGKPNRKYMDFMKQYESLSKGA